MSPWSVCLRALIAGAFVALMLFIAWPAQSQINPMTKHMTANALQTCEPIPDIVERLQKLATVTVKMDPDYVRDYASRIGYPLPRTLSFAGAVFYDMGEPYIGATVFLFNGCPWASIIIPRQTHENAMKQMEPI